MMRNVLGCVVSSGHFCRLDTPLHPVNKIQECHYFLFEDDKEKISKYCQISILNQTRDQAISIDLDYNHYKSKNVMYIFSYLSLSINFMTSF